MAVQNVFSLPTAASNRRRLRPRSADAGGVRWETPDRYDIRDFADGLEVVGADILAALNAFYLELPVYGGVLDIPLRRPTLSGSITTYGRPAWWRGLGVQADIYLNDEWNAGTEIKWTGGAAAIISPGARDLTFATTDVDTGANTITETAHGFLEGQLVKLSSTGTLPGGLATADAWFYVRNPAANTFQLASSPGGSVIDITSQGTGTHTVHQAVRGGGFDGLALNGNATATAGFNFKRVRSFTLGVLAVRNLAAGGVGYDFNTDGSALAADNSMLITAEHLIAKTPVIAKFRGNQPTASTDTCFTSINRIQGQHGTAGGNENGYVFENADNVRIDSIVAGRDAGTGFGIEIQARARSLVFGHVETGAGGLIARTPTNASQVAAYIGWYDRDNGEPAPTVEAGAILHFREGGSLLPGGCYTNTARTAPINSGYNAHVRGGAGGTGNVEDIVETIATNGVVDHRLIGKTGSTTMTWRVLVNSDGVIYVGSNSAHPLWFRTGGTDRLRLRSDGHLEFIEAINMVLGTTTGTKIGTATNQKLGFYNATPVVQRSAISSPTADVTSLKTAVDAIRQVFIDLGLTA